MDDYEYAIEERLKPEFGHIPVKMLDWEQIEDYFNRLQDPNHENLTGSTVNEYYTIFKKAIDRIQHEEGLDYNPVKRAKTPSQEPEWNSSTSKDDDITILTGEEVDRLINVIESKNPWAAPIYHLVAATGLRRGEALGLRWRNIDFERNVIRIRRQLVESGGVVYMDDLKTKSSRRGLPVDREVMNILKIHKQRQEYQKEEVGKDSFYDHSTEDFLPETDLRDWQFVFTSNRKPGRPWHPDSISAQPLKWWSDAGIPKVNFHSLRHYHASLLIKEGVDIETIRDRLGHEDISTTINFYGHLMDEQDESASIAYSEARSKRRENRQNKEDNHGKR